MRRVLTLSDSLSPWHSFWIRFGQYVPSLAVPIQISDDPSLVDQLQCGDTLFLYRFNPNWWPLMERLPMLRRMGIRLISDVDDCLWQAPLGWDRSRLKGITKFLSQCDLITCSTEPLHELLEVMFSRQNILLVRNSTPPGSPRPPLSLPPAITLCWTGAPWTRPLDLALLRPMAQWIQENQLPVRWRHVGHAPERLSFASAIGVPPDTVEPIPLCGHQDYLNQLRGTIGLAPMTAGCFNSFKSELKLLEFSGAGMAWIASDAPAYRHCCERWGWPGRLCSSAEDWIHHLQSLMNPIVRETEARELQRLACTQQSHSMAVEQWNVLLAPGIHR